MQSEVNRAMSNLCGDRAWKVIAMEAHDFPIGAKVFEVEVGEGVYKQQFLAVTPTSPQGLYATKSLPDGRTVAYGLTQWGSLFNAIQKGVTDEANIHRV